MKKTPVFFVFTCVMGLMFTSVSAQEVSIPVWIKNNAGWWADGQIPDSTFVLGIQFLIQEEIIIIPNLPEHPSEKTESIPAWIKNNAGWWADGQIDDKTFVKGIEYLVNVGIIVINQIDDADQILHSVTEKSGVKTSYTEKIREVSGNQFIIIVNEIERQNGEKITLSITKSAEHVILVDEKTGERYLIIEGLVRNASNELAKMHLHVLENENGRQIIYYEHIVDDNLFRKLYEPKHMEMKPDGVISITKFNVQLKDEHSETYKKIGVDDTKSKPLFIIPTFTASAYSEPGFYTFYRGECDTELHDTLFRDEDCLTVEILSKDDLGFTSSANAVQMLELLGYESITDMELHTNPSILDEYDKIIVLHNEYVSKIMFDAITSHDSVIFLYPNALYAEVEVDIITNTITLIRGHNYPDLTIKNGFDWINENTHPYEYDHECENWEFYPTKGTPDGQMLNCYPENKLWQGELLLKALKDL